MGGAVVLVVVIGGVVRWWDPSPAPLPDYFIHNPISKVLHREARPKLPQLAAAPQYAPIPAPLTAAPPAEVWLPQRQLTDDDKAKRLATDQFLMKAETLHRGTLTNTFKLQGELANQQYDQLESQLDAILALSVADPAYELLEKDAANFADGNDVARGADKFLIDDWLKARPNSPWAHYSAGLRWSNMAWDVRGSGWASQVPGSSWPKVHLYEGNARAELHKALKLNPKLALAWMELINVDTTDAGLADAKRDYVQGSMQRPDDFDVPNQFANTLNPHWDGSYEAIADFAQAEQDKVGVNPRFRILLGLTEGDRGCITCNNYDWSTSLKHFNAALFYADDIYWLDKAGESAAHLHRYALAYRYYERAHAYQPGTFRFYAEMQLLQAACDPKEDPEKFKVLKSTSQVYGGIESMEYPHLPDSCSYYQAELPWGTEPQPDAGSLLPYEIGITMPSEQQAVKK